MKSRRSAARGLPVVERVPDEVKSFRAEDRDALAHRAAQRRCVDVEELVQVREGDPRSAAHEGVVFPQVGARVAPRRKDVRVAPRAPRVRLEFDDGAVELRREIVRLVLGAHVRLAEHYQRERAAGHAVPPEREHLREHVRARPGGHEHVEEI